jgi:hypothetical protein
LGKTKKGVTRIHVHPISNDNVYVHRSEFSVSIAEKLIEELEKDPKIRRRLAELMVTDSDVRLAIINAVLADVATKSDLEKLEERLERRISALENGVNSIEERMARLEGQMGLFVKPFIAFNLPTLIAVIGILLRMVFS